MSSGWLNGGWYLIRMSYGRVIMSSGWDTLPILSHPDEIAHFDFPHHAVALQRFRNLSTVYLKSSEKINCAISEIQWWTKIKNVVESYLLPGGMVQTDSQWKYDPSTIKLASYFSRSLRRAKSLHFWSVIGKVHVWSRDIVIIEHHA